MSNRRILTGQSNKDSLIAADNTIDIGIIIKEIIKATNTKFITNA